MFYSYWNSTELHFNMHDTLHFICFKNFNKIVGLKQAVHNTRLNTYHKIINAKKYFNGNTNLRYECWILNFN